MPSRLRATALVLALAFLLSTAAVEAATHPYPARAKSAFMKGCTRKASRTLCTRALRCVQGKLTYKQFIAAGIAINRHRSTHGTRIVRSCGRQAALGHR